jgi:hypothetical protein
MAGFSASGLTTAHGGLASAATLACLHSSDTGVAGGWELPGGSGGQVAVAFGLLSGGAVTAPVVTVTRPDLARGNAGQAGK